MLFFPFFLQTGATRILLYLARATQVMDREVHDPHSCLDNVGTLHSSLEEAKTALSIALMYEAHSTNNGFIELNILCDEPLKARCVVRSFDANGNKGLWMETVIRQVNEMKVS